MHGSDRALRSFKTRHRSIPEKTQSQGHVWELLSLSGGDFKEYCVCREPSSQNITLTLACWSTRLALSSAFELHKHRALLLLLLPDCIHSHSKIKCQGSYVMFFFLPVTTPWGVILLSCTCRNRSTLWLCCGQSTPGSFHCQSLPGGRPTTGRTWAQTLEAPWTGPTRTHK